MLLVQKYGGSSLADSWKVAAVAEKIATQRKNGDRIVAVVSARGDMTDRLLALAREAAMEPAGRELDACLAAGEQVSAALLALALQEIGCPAVSLTGIQAGIRTDGVYGNARVTGLSGDRIREELENGKVVVAAGFQGLGPNGDVVTLGRGGSDTTAVALAAFLDAQQCRIYTDVDGVYDEDPRKNPLARRYDALSYDEMLALCHRGARVLHDRAVELAREKQVPLQVLSSFRPGPGTWVR